MPCTVSTTIACSLSAVVRKRLGEKAAKRGGSLADGDLGHLRAACESSSLLQVVMGQGSEWTALLSDRATADEQFVDIYSSEDPYPEGMWAALSAHLETLQSADTPLPGGRYSCAQALLDSELPLLSGRALGEVCHIVQLALTGRKLLGYLDGAIVPYSCSNSCAKDAAAEMGVGSGGNRTLPLASWEATHDCLVEILKGAVRKHRRSVPISTLKRLFRSRFHLELSETALGHTKLSDLLQDRRLRHICQVELQERGYVMIPLLKSPEAMSDGSTCAGDEETASASGSDAATACSKGHAGARVPLLVLQNTFWQTPAPALGASRRCKSLPRDLGSCIHGRVLEADSDDDVSPTPALTESPCWTPRCVEPASFGSVPPGNFASDPWHFDGSACFGCAVPEPTWPGDAEAEALPPAPAHEPGCWAGFPGCKVASTVRKTFVELDEPSPLAKGSRRSRSLPRSLGSSDLDEDGSSTCSDAIDLTCSAANPASSCFEAPSEQWTALAEDIAASFEGHKAMSICLSDLL